MSTIDTLNIASLNMVHDELVATIEQAAINLENFTQQQTNHELLQACIDGIKQIRGTLSLLEMRGVDLLAEELVAHINEASLAAASETQLETLTSCFFLLPRYLEYCSQSGKSMPSLLIPAINNLRIIRKAPLLSENYYHHFASVSSEPRPLTPARQLEEPLTLVVRRLRHMYQTVLLNILKESQINASFKLMARALERLENISSSGRLGNFWWLARAAVTAMNEMNMPLSATRKRVLTQVEREIRRFQFEGDAVINREVDSALQHELLYLVCLSHADNPLIATVMDAYGVAPLATSDRDLQREVEFLNGPSAATVTSMVVVLNDEVQTAKNMVEHSSQGGAELILHSPELKDSLKKIADILLVLGLHAPSKSLNQQLDLLSSWERDQVAVSESDLLELANTLLYVEGTIAGLVRSNLSDGKIAELNALTRDEAMANNQLASAERLVIEEAEAGLMLVKRALNTFADSNFDKAHIRNITSSLDSVRGGLFVLGFVRASNIVAASIQFVDNMLLSQDLHPAIGHLLETFADAIISLEYYIDAIKMDKDADTSVLGVAEESLSALGFNVS